MAAHAVSYGPHLRGVQRILAPLGPLSPRQPALPPQVPHSAAPAPWVAGTLLLRGYYAQTRPDHKFHSPLCSLRHFTHTGARVFLVCCSHKTPCLRINTLANYEKLTE